MSLSWRQAEEIIAAERGRFLSPRAPIHVARAPARLDVMGGIADYSGSLVLEGTLARAAYAAVQPRRDGKLRAMSVGVTEAQPVEISLDDLLTRGRPKSYPQVRKLFGGAARWAGYVLGTLHVLQREGVVAQWPHGLNLLLLSDIPIGAGVASSAAIEVAAMVAVTAAYGVALEPLRLAQLCQMVENRVVGAPCGIMDQVTSALGQTNRLLALCCQPCEVEGLHRVPEGYQFVGINSAVKHSVGGTAYGRVRCAAFMGYRIMEDLLPAGDYGGFWCRATAAEFAAIEAELPVEMVGREFLARYGRTRDAVTAVQPDMAYPVRQASRHPVLENARVRRFVQLLGRGDEGAMRAAGKLMLESHASYSACGLGADETDLLVRLVRERGAEAGLLGAKITGGGSGGTVAVLIRNEARPLLRDITREYRRRTGLSPLLLTGSTAGAARWGTRTI
ncbi:GHMP kinase [bacterium]|nr:GHMP kinase [bacterium]